MCLRTFVFFKGQEPTTFWQAYKNKVLDTCSFESKIDIIIACQLKVIKSDRTFTNSDWLSRNDTLRILS